MQWLLNYDGYKMMAHTPQDPNWLPTQFRNRVAIRNIDHDSEAAMAWCRENIDSMFQFDITRITTDLSGYSVTLYSFAKPEDAMAFKLRWI